MDRSRTAAVLAYHEATKHRLHAYARGPETLDWDAQPAPFRRYEGCHVVPLPLSAARFDTRSDALYEPPAEARAASLEWLGALLELSFGLSAWKSNGVERWAVRVNPSSGNLHPTEVYLLCVGCSGLADGLYHYRAEEHALALRAPLGVQGEPPLLLVGLSALTWREAWKYGERAFRYCQLDLGHATAALACAANLLGQALWALPEVPSALMGSLLGLDRSADFPSGRRAEVEREQPELLFALAPHGTDPTPRCTPAQLAAYARALSEGGFRGAASRVDPHPLYSWPSIDAVAEATAVREPRGPWGALAQPASSAPPRTPHDGAKTARELVLGRRSSQRYDRAAVMPLASFAAVLAACLPSTRAPFSASSHVGRIALVLFVHRVEGLTPGVYLLPRYADALAELSGWLKPELAPVPCAELPAALGLCKLSSVEPGLLARLTRAFSCHQEIASSACFTLGMLAAFDAPLAHDASLYRTLFREAGVLGQALYLEAEAHGLRGTGIGCFFDDVVHELLSTGGSARQSLYHFAVGRSLDDPRIETSAPYGARATPHGK